MKYKLPQSKKTVILSAIDILEAYIEKQLPSASRSAVLVSITETKDIFNNKDVFYEET